MIPTTEWNVIIVGGGIAACSTAIALSRRRVDRLCLLHLAPIATRVAVGETVPPDIRRALGELGLWESFLEQQHEPCFGSCSAWGVDEPGYNDFVLSPLGFGWHLDRGRFEKLLLDEAKKVGIAFFPLAKSPSAQEGSSGCVVLHAVTPDGDERTFTAKHVVDATGSRSAVSRQMGARQILLDRLSFVYGFFDRSEAGSTSRLTLLEAVEFGWWYSARLPDGKRVVALASDPSIIRDGSLAHAEEWLGLLRKTKHIAHLVQECRLSNIVVRIAPAFQLDRVAGANWLAAGDAAAACDPICSQGIMNALEDGIRAATALADFRRSDSNEVYADYLSTRYADYLANRNYFYGLERRWPKSLFWKRRVVHGSKAPLSNTQIASAAFPLHSQ